MKSYSNVKRTVKLMVAMTSMSFAALAQNEADVAAFLKATKQDANALITGYTAPLIKGASYGTTGGWFTTAKTHKKLGFDIAVSATLAITPSSDDYFNPKPQLSPSTTFTNTTNPSSGAPTFLGPKDKTVYTTTTPEGSVSYNGPEGLDLRHNLHFAAVPVPMIQLGIGLIKNTDLKVRFLPSVSHGNTKVSMLGFGLMHDIKQYFPGSDLLPFDLSILLGYNSIKGVTNLANAGQNENAPLSPNGKFNYKLNSWVGQAIISKKLSVITFYAAAGYGSVNTTADITGTFNYTVGTEAVSLTDPFATKFKNRSAKLTGGVRLKLGPIYFVGDYTLQKYNALTIGLGVSIR